MSLNRSKVFLKVNRVDAALCKRALEATVADLHEAMGPHGRAGLMSARMRPIVEGARIAGPAVTAFCGAGDNLMMHRALYLAQPGDVLVVVCQSELSGAQWGDLATRYAQKKGLAGVVVHGCARDVDTVRQLGFPVWATHIHPMHPDKRGHGFVNTPVACDGVLSVPRALAAEAIEGALARMRKEEDAAAAMAGGAAVWDLSGAAAVYATMDVEEIDAACDDAVT